MKPLTLVKKASGYRSDAILETAPYRKDPSWNDQLAEVVDLMAKGKSYEEAEEIATRDHPAANR